MNFLMIYLFNLCETPILSHHDHNAIFSRMVFSQKQYGENGSSPTIFNQKSSAWSHLKERTKPHNCVEAFLNFSFIVEISNFEVD